jgi:hypothetical protein
MQFSFSLRSAERKHRSSVRPAWARPLSAWYPLILAHATCNTWQVAIVVSETVDWGISEEERDGIGGRIGRGWESGAEKFKAE